MGIKKIALAYSIDNLPVAEAIAQALEPSNYPILHFYCKKSGKEAPLAEQLRDFDGTILLLISDNFLKSVACMNRALALLQQKGSQLLPVVIDGRSKDEATQRYVHTPTKFERIGDIIPYINYWQNQYLDLRSQKRRSEGEDEFDKEALNEHLRILRQVSSEASEFLRVLRNMRYLQFEALTANHFQALFQFLEDEEAWMSFKAKVPQLEIVIHDELSVPVELTGAESPAPISVAIPAAPPSTPPAVAIPAPLIAETTPAEDDLPPVEEEDPKDLAERIQDYIRQGRLMVSEGDVEGGLKFLSQALRQHPGNADLHYVYGFLLAQNTTALDQAALQLDLALTANPGHESALFLQGELAELRQDYTAARQFYENLVSRNPNYPEADYRLAMVLQAHFPNDAVLAQKYFSQAIQSQPDNADIRYQYGVLLNEQLGEYHQARTLFQETLTIQPRHPFAHYDLAILFHQEGDMAAAREHYLQAIAINPELQTPDNDLAFQEPETAWTEDPVITEPELPVPPTPAPAPPPPVVPAAPSPLETTLAPPAASATYDDEKDTIELLRQNLLRLEEMLTAKVRAEVEAKLLAPPHPPQTVFISGASSGIGRATALLFAQNGHRVIINGRREENLRALEREIQAAQRGAVVVLPFDVTQRAQVEQSLDTLPAEWRNIDILINNAGKAKGLAPIHEGELAHWEEMIDTNLKGLLYLTRQVAQGMVARHQGHIINVGSIAGKDAYPNGNVYCATKAAVDMLTKTMRMDLHRHGIKVSQVAPGAVEETEFSLVRFDGDAEKARIYADFQPLTAHDVAEVIYYLATTPAHVNIQDVVVMPTQQAAAAMIDRSGRREG